ncbi:hypothetical protein NT06LI_3265 [Listeria innocua FSL J1-023]|nr:hypothetical protein NT06LI_3265 [Listeria innocua FSL J1-023]
MYSYYVDFFGISEEVFWNRPFFQLNRYVKNKIAVDAWKQHVQKEAAK